MVLDAMSLLENSSISTRSEKKKSTENSSIFTESEEEKHLPTSFYSTFSLLTLPLILFKHSLNYATESMPGFLFDCTMLIN